MNPEGEGQLEPAHSDNDESIDQKEFMKDIERKRLLIKYKEENNSLRTQLKQLNERLNTVLQKQTAKLGQKSKLPTITTLNNQEVLRRELENVYKSLEINKKQVKHYQEVFKEDVHERVKQLEDQLGQKDSEIDALTKQNRNLLRLHKIPYSENRDQQKLMRGKLEQLTNEVARLKKTLRDLEKEKSLKQKDEIKRQEYVVSLEQKNRNLLLQQQAKPPLPPLEKEKPPAATEQHNASAITHMEMSEENWNYIKLQFLQVKEAKAAVEAKLRAENSALRNRIQILEKSMDILKGRQGEVRQRGLLTDRRYDRKQNNSTIDVVEDRPSQLLSSAVVEENDKNIHIPPQNNRLNQSLQARHIGAATQLQTLQSFSWGKPVDRKWTDAKVFKESREVRITGLVVWYTDVIVGLRFSYRAHSKAIFTDEHVILRSKDFHKNMFEFTGDDFLQNIVLYEQDGKLVGMTIISRQNKQFEVGKQTSKAVDLGIRPPLVPVYGFGSLGSIIDINKIERYSTVASLGLQAISL